MFFSGDLTDLSSTNVALRAAKGTEEANKLHVDLTRHFGKTPFIAFNSPESIHAAGSGWYSGPGTGPGRARPGCFHD
jgi:hypothetical protein